MTNTDLRELTPEEAEELRAVNAAAEEARKRAEALRATADARAKAKDAERAERAARIDEALTEQAADYLDGLGPVALNNKVAGYNGEHIHAEKKKAWAEFVKAVADPKTDTVSAWLAYRESLARAFYPAELYYRHLERVWEEEKKAAIQKANESNDKRRALNAEENAARNRYPARFGQRPAELDAALARINQAWTDLEQEVNAYAKKHGGPGLSNLRGRPDTLTESHLLTTRAPRTSADDPWKYDPRRYPEALSDAIAEHLTAAHKRIEAEVKAQQVADATEEAGVE